MEVCLLILILHLFKHFNACFCMLRIQLYMLAYNSIKDCLTIALSMNARYIIGTEQQALVWYYNQTLVWF